MKITALNLIRSAYNVVPYYRNDICALISRHVWGLHVGERFIGSQIATSWQKQPGLGQNILIHSKSLGPGATCQTTPKCPYSISNNSLCFTVGLVDFAVLCLHFLANSTVGHAHCSSNDFPSEQRLKLILKTSLKGMEAATLFQVGIHHPHLHTGPDWLKLLRHHYKFYTLAPNYVSADFD